MTQAQIAKVLAANPALLAALGAMNVKPAKQAKRTKADMLAAKDRSIKATFTKRGIKDVVLMDRTDPTAEFNVRPYGRELEDGSRSGWLGQGRQVKKGESSVRGLFHISQTEVVA
jgi:hypothetical protein